MPETPQLAARLAAARDLRQAPQRHRAACADRSAHGRTYTEDAYRKAYSRTRAAAVEGVPIKGLEPCPSLSDFRDQDLRDTAVTWLADAGCTLLEIRAITGHNAETIAQILKHYCAVTSVQASSAIGKLVTYLEKEGAAL